MTVREIIFKEVDYFRTNHCCREGVPVADDCAGEISPADIRAASLYLNRFNVPSCPQVSVYCEECGVINVAELVQVLEDLYYVSQQSYL